MKETLSERITTSTSQKEYRSPTEVHHIAAQNSYKAEEARTILNEIFPDGTENPANKVTLSTKLHRRIHTNLYYTTVNTLIVASYESAGDDKEKAKSNVLSTLGMVKGMLSVLDSLTQ